MSCHTAICEVFKMVQFILIGSTHSQVDTENVGFMVPFDHKPCPPTLTRTRSRRWFLLQSLYKHLVSSLSFTSPHHPLNLLNLLNTNLISSSQQTTATATTSSPSN